MQERSPPPIYVPTYVCRDKFLRKNIPYGVSLASLRSFLSSRMCICRGCSRLCRKYSVAYCIVLWNVVIVCTYYACVCVCVMLRVRMRPSSRTVQVCNVQCRLESALDVSTVNDCPTMKLIARISIIHFSRLQITDIYRFTLLLPRIIIARNVKFIIFFLCRFSSSFFLSTFS